MVSKLKASSSMLPLIHSQDRLIISKSKKLNFEDIVVFKQNNILKAHRILHLSKDHLITKGDNNPKADNKIQKKQILGVVHQIKRGKEIITLNHLYFSQSIKYFKIISSLINKLDKNNISYVFLKGLPIHLHYKKSPPRHLYFDLDILISKNNLKKVNNLIIQMGFSKPDKSLYQTCDNPTQYNYYKIDKPINIFIDLHTEPGFGFTKSTHINSLLPNPNILTKYLMDDSQKVYIDKQKIPLLNPEAQTILLFLHFFHHNYKQIHKLSIIKHINKKGLNWNKLFTDIEKLKISPYLKPAIILFNQYYPNIVPQLHMNTIKSFKNSLITPVHYRGVFNNQNQRSSGTHRFFLILYLSESSFIEKVKIILNKKTLVNFYKVIKSFFTNTSTKSSTSPKA